LSRNGNARQQSMRLGLFQCLCQISQDIINIFKSHRQTDHARRNTGLTQLGISKLTVGRAGRVQHTAADISHMYLQ